MHPETPKTLTGHVVVPGSPGYEEASTDFNTRFPPANPRYVVFCETPEDVQRAVQWSRAYKYPLRARSGRHSYEAFSLVDDGVIIDVSPMNEVRLDAERGIAEIGAGANLLEVYEGLWNQGRVTIPGGSCPTVGIAGLTLGGGFGLSGRLLGLTCDSLIAVELVTADGELITASDEEHPHLFWACRGGGGGNFGIATRFTFRVHPVDEVTIFSMSWDWSYLPVVTATFLDWADPEHLDERLTPILKLPAAAAGSVAAVGQFAAGPEELYRLLAPLVRAAPPLHLEINRLSYIDAVYHFAGLKKDPERWQVHQQLEHSKFKNTSAYLYEPFDDAGLEILHSQLEQAPSAACLVQLDGYGGAVNRVPVDATAFPHRRGVRANLQYQAYWTHDEEAAAHIRWVEGFREAMLPWTRGAYVNYCDRDIEDWPTAYYGQNVARLVEVKRRYDPENVFDFPQGIGRVP